MQFRTYLLRAAAVAAFATALPAMAGVITFDEFAADNFPQGGFPSNRYAFLGVTFHTTDDGSTWDGLGFGDPGNWLIAGTNGHIFSGYNGQSYGASLNFDAAASGVLLDVSRSNGSQDGDTFTLEGYFQGLLVESHTVTLGGLNQWTTVAIAGVVDELRWHGNGASFHPYGMDNIRWNVPEPASLALLGIGLAGLGFSRRKQ